MNRINSVHDKSIEKSKNSAKVSFAGKSPAIGVEKIKDSISYIKRSLQQSNSYLITDRPLNYTKPSSPPSTRLRTPKSAKSHKHLTKFETKVLKRSFFRDETNVYLFEKILKNYEKVKSLKKVSGDKSIMPNFDEKLFEENFEDKIKLSKIIINLPNDERILQEKISTENNQNNTNNSLFLTTAADNLRTDPTQPNTETPKNNMKFATSITPKSKQDFFGMEKNTHQNFEKAKSKFRYKKLSYDNIKEISNNEENVEIVSRLNSVKFKLDICTDEKSTIKLQKNCKINII